MQRSFKSSSIRIVRITDSYDSLRFFPLDCFPNLMRLSISFCKNLESLDGDGMLMSLSDIFICGCPNFVSFPKGGLHDPNMTSLTFGGSKKLKKLPEQMRNLPFLNSLLICNCPELESFLEDGLPFNLNRLWVRKCPKLIAQRMKWNLHALQALKDFSIAVNVEEEALQQLNSLEYLRILECPQLKKLPQQGLPTSLKHLYISNCPQLEKLLQQGLPTSLERLDIHVCPVLEESCQRVKGEHYWNTISHISEI
ncbi:hypothetical protein FEM48_Zijuj05G0179300 [Ziziphus jujuba var. spinosa]|uniref:Disease resistance protein At3g14460 n=1 Tax=Ziziphus jujuba var. spinosa TaxID=714518 RepID=A0A978VGA2_ZIZJJ|nr:hypothetical protein FEM48_Zijuj05G0179300 [Ziziphus jujuba var. spinosa]